MAAQPDPTPSNQQAAARLGVRAPLRPVPFVSDQGAHPESRNLPPAWAAHAARRPQRAAVVSESVRNAAVQRAQASTPPSQMDRIAPRPVNSGVLADTRTVVVGLGLLLTDAVPELFSPIAFFTRNAAILARAAIYLSVPLVVTVAIYLLVPGMVSAFPINTWAGLGYLSAMFLASGICTCLALAGMRGIGAGVLAVISAARRRATG